MIDKNNLKQVQELFNYNFRNKNLLIQALTTPQLAHQKEIKDYQILETIGDAVIKLIFLIKKHKAGVQKPGKITKIKQQLENDNMLKKIARKYFQLDKFVLKAEAQEIKGTKILADIFEAICGAIYLDSNEDIKMVEEKIINKFYDDWDILVKGSAILNKSELLEFLQSKLRITPEIKTEFESFGPDNQPFWIAKNPKIYDENNRELKNLTKYIEELSSKQSKTKKEAEQNLFLKIEECYEK
jgi:dsRNA-specific ribonuclease